MTVIDQIPLENAQILVLGVARNCAKTLKADIFKIRDAFGDAKSLVHYVVESDSTDETVEILEQLAQEISDFSYAALGDLAKMIPQRTARLAHCRNQYVQYARDYHQKNDIDYVVVADLDGINNKLTRSSVQSCWARKDWAACFANQKGPYYDIWALRHELWSPNDCWAQERFIRDLTGSKLWSTFTSVHSRQMRIPEESEWIEVDSAYGGLGVYVAAIFVREGEHVGLDDSGYEICDIPPFHEAIKTDDSRFFINPRLINGYNNEHTRKLVFPRVVKTAFKVARYLVCRGVSFR